MHKGSCLCGAVHYEFDAPLSSADACHCTQCRKQSGHYWAATDVPRSALLLHGEEHVTWYRSSEKVRRGFCSICGSVLFWQPIHKDVIAISMGSLDQPTGIRLDKHIFVADKGDYYELKDGVQQNLQ